MRPQIGSDTWLKLDVEGGEYEIVPVLLKSTPRLRLITMEIHEFNLRGDSLLRLLRESGYSIAGDTNAGCTIAACL